MLEYVVVPYKNSKIVRISESIVVSVGVAKFLNGRKATKFDHGWRATKEELN